MRATQAMLADSVAYVLLCLEKTDFEPFKTGGAVFSSLLSGDWHVAGSVSWSGRVCVEILEACSCDCTLAADRRITVCCAAASVLRRVMCHIQTVCPDLYGMILSWHLHNMRQQHKACPAIRGTEPYTSLVQR